MSEEKKKVTITIDGRKVAFDEGLTIMEAADLIGIHIPRLCYHPELSLAGSCRVCIVDVKDMGFFMASCSVKIWEGMEVETNSPDVRQARRDIVELLLDNHSKDCQTCERDGNCELQNLAYRTGVRERIFEGRRKDLPADESGKSVIREPNKCILCGRCVRVCDEVQGVCNLSQQGRGFTTFVSPAHGQKMDESVCIQCGQCINVCPTAAFLEKRHTQQVWDAIANPDIFVVAQTAPSIRAAIGEGFGLKPGTPSTGRMVSSLRQLGFNAVFDTDFGADLTIVEESAEFIRRLNGQGPLPLLTSCSPGWISYLEKFYPELIPHASSCRSPMSMMSVLIKTYYAQKQGIDPDKIFVVGVMPCVAKKYEASRPEHMMPDGQPYTDAVLTTRELIWMIKSFGIEYWTETYLDAGKLPSMEFDAPLGISTGAGDIFGCTGGVMEATLRTAYEKLTGKTCDKLEFYDVRAVEGLREATLDIGGKKINIGVANGLVNAKTLLDKVISGEKQFHVIEIMACPGGCIGGGGQPYPAHRSKVRDDELLKLRAQALYSIDQRKTLRKSHDNPAVIELYKNFLGEIGGEKAHELLHTHYSAKLPRGIK